MICEQTETILPVMLPPNEELEGSNVNKPDNKGLRRTHNLVCGMCQEM